MVASSALGFTFFVTCNFLGIRGAALVGIAQIAINVFVHRSWWRGFLECQGWKRKTFTGVGAVVPIVMASITIYRVLLPAIGRWLGV